MDMNHYFRLCYILFRAPAKRRFEASECHTEAADILGHEVPWLNKIM